MDTTEDVGKTFAAKEQLSLPTLRLGTNAMDEKQLRVHFISEVYDPQFYEPAIGVF